MKNFIWDFDGTLFDTYPYMVTAFAKALRKNGIDPIEINPDEIYAQMRIHSLGSAIIKFSALYGIDQERLLKDYRNYEQDEVNLAKPFENVKQVLQLIVANGGKNGLLTHRDDQALHLLEKYDIKKLFTGLVTSKQSFARKPNPESLNYLIKKMNLEVNETAMVGDRELDVAAGNNAGVITILFDFDYMIENDGNPDFIVHSIKEIIPLIKGTQDTV
ncbi:hypothetical protein BGL34_01660 [Fructilactobacillus lindneri]|uniref:Phosphoglycolate phosphatase n=2 Tax=Fructilactobacillus lindneri TaxID=53444 RepID=A0A0R2JP67_9LACO|nr:HAD-IA family hydrolase [Fructilactobacillus lindneri]ANZ58125.1 hypothetical protein AYR60_04925 [Fructilactobacillus lindneri]ANZ59446.1 hypothetical protein AYR59_05180 [Fructilactobacillus lindneri]KRN78943.1 hypothetical protein IV52_GL000347 [Fructilactobacillus lindneri DSM 20690 = JCM 11027]POG98770.1 hypothetical protein BGL31_02250 [Fructilactobacillus lindneri]POH03043.1 hypothetical protein BGL33_03685 [Fructilactobacillus lindneri]